MSAPQPPRARMTTSRTRSPTFCAEESWWSRHQRRSHRLQKQFRWIVVAKSGVEMVSPTSPRAMYWSQPAACRTPMISA